MPRLEWDKIGERLYETGVKNGVLYPQDNSGEYPEGVEWNGLTAVNESPSGAEATPLYADDIKYVNLRSAEEFAATVEAYTYPEEFEPCDGSVEIASGISIGQQPRKSFGLSYKTTLGNDVQNDSYGYKIHLIYGCTASPSEKSYSTINDSPEAITFSWEVTTTPVNVDGYKPTALLSIDSTRVTDISDLRILEAVLYGADEFSSSKTYSEGDVVTHSSSLYTCIADVETAGAWDSSDWQEVTLTGGVGPRLPLPNEVVEIVGESSVSE